MDHERLKTLGETEKSRVYLVFDSERQRMLVEKRMAGEVEVYQKLSELRHPYLPRIESVRFEQGETIVIEEYIPGGSLSQIRADERQLSRWLLELCDVLEFLHGKQIIHRDIKPSNLLLGEDGHIRLIDFDAAREQKESADNDTRLLGTRGYAPPEQYGFAQTDRRADLYAVGITWKALLGDKAERQPCHAVLQKCTDLNPRKRYGSAKELAFAWRTRTIRRFLPWMAACAAIFAVLGGWYWYQTALPEITESRYPEEELLFYATYGDYIAADLDDLRENGKIHTMEIDLDGDGQKETIRLCSNADGAAQAILQGTAAEKTDLFAVMLDAMPAAYYMAHQYPLSADELFWSTREDDLLQITCLDLDQDGSMEILLSLGDRTTHTVTGVFQWDGSRIVPRGCMWGSTGLKLLPDGIIEGALLPNVYGVSNRYTYAGEVSAVSEVDYETYWDGLEYGVSFEDYKDMIGAEPSESEDEPSRQYNMALAYLDAQMYQSAINVLVALGDYERSGELLSYARMMLYHEQEMPGEEERLEIAYYEAVLALERGDYPAAVMLFGQLGEYKDCTSQRANAYENVVRGLLENRLTFVDTETRNEAALISGNPVVSGEAHLFALVDFDEDGLKELVIEYDGAGDRLILHLMDGVVRGYYATCREMKTIKENGSYDFSNGADSGGVAACYFTEWYRQEVIILEADGTAGRWTLGGVEITEDQYYNAAMPEFYRMADAQWYEFENILKILGFSNG